jgi:hypothetical protein
MATILLVFAAGFCLLWLLPVPEQEHDETRRF